VGTVEGGLYYLVLSTENRSQNPRLVRFSEIEGLLNNDIRAIHEDREQQIWIGTKKGLSRLRMEGPGFSGTAIHYTQKEGIPSPYINTITSDQDDNIWVGSGSGLFRLDLRAENELPIVTFYGVRRKIFMNTIRSIVKDAHGELWIGSEVGILKIISPGKDQAPYILTKFTRQDGLKASNFLFNAALIDQYQTSWWGNYNGGVLAIPVNEFSESRAELRPRITALSINERFPDFRHPEDSLLQGIEFDSIKRFDNLPLRPSFRFNQNNLTFHFAAIDWTAPAKIQYSFRMKGLEEGWSRHLAESKAEYRSLPFGHYTFEVCAKGESEIWSPVTSYSFTIRPPWWYSWWAWLSYGLIGISMSYQVYRFQLHRKLELAEKNRLVELDAVKNRLYSNITHEFRTPLTLIHGPVSQAIQSNRVLETKDIQSIHRQSERLQQLINQMLELQKLESGKMKIQYEYGDVISFLRYLFKSFETWAKEKNISLILSSHLHEVYMDMDREKLTQIMTNLVSNAIKHTPRGGKVGMGIEITPDGQKLIVKLRDTGAGISPEDLPFIFDRYYQSPKAASGGTGIGLALAKSLTELLEGSLTVESIPEQGSTFTIALPITRNAQVMPNFGSRTETNEAIHEEDGEMPFSEASEKDRRPHILIIEDHMEIAQYVAECLTPGYQTQIAMNGNEGIEMAMAHIPDLIISDIMMPGKDGFELTATLKTNILTSHIPIILLTGRGDHDALLKGIEHGADVYLTKPFDPAELALRVKKLLELRANLRAYYRGPSQDPGPEFHAHVSSREQEFIQKVKVFIEENLNNAQFNMNLLCKHMAMSHPQLHRKITALTGESAGKLVRSVRLQKAIELLRNSDLSISEIAYETGFSEPGYFTKIFSKEYQMTPTEYRNKLV
jgi:signal transduction histidine kinase/DNA-binding response OmpR family regulator